MWNCQLPIGSALVTDDSPILNDMNFQWKWAGNIPEEPVGDNSSRNGKIFLSKLSHYLSRTILKWCQLAFMCKSMQMSASNTRLVWTLIWTSIWYFPLNTRLKNTDVEIEQKKFDNKENLKSFKTWIYTTPYYK
jgi:hypothetical protein